VDYSPFRVVARGKVAEIPMALILFPPTIIATYVQVSMGNNVFAFIILMIGGLYFLIVRHSMLFIVTDRGIIVRDIFFEEPVFIDYRDIISVKAKKRTMSLLTLSYDIDVVALIDGEVEDVFIVCCIRNALEIIKAITFYINVACDSSNMEV